MEFNNYSTVFEKEVEDLKSKSYLLKHEKTGARIFILSNDDDNKVFYIGFRTPSIDSTGVAHITEHSTLCGSEKYPLKDPFVELVKGSLNTFLNAMTYPDKTVYPVASRNDQDFKNLMSVYMDAVLKPNIYKHPEILRQEGWSYKIENPEDPIEYNGVVYNEMKGAFSLPEGVLERETLHALFPDTSYAFESGGDPEFITDLTYEGFLDFHKRYYHPSNSFIYLYGDMDIEERLKWLDEEYLSKYEKIDIDSEVKTQEPFEKMAEEEIFYAISDEESEEDNTYLSYNINCGDNLDPYKYYAMQMILYALVDTQGAPVRQSLLDAGIGKDIMSGFDTSIKQEYFSITAKNANPSDKEKFLQIINAEFKKAADEGLNKKSLVACLNSIEFKFREADFDGYPKGLVYGLDALDSWLYDEEKPLLHIECSETFKALRERINGTYYEELIREYLLDNSNSALIVLKPKKGLTAEKEEALKKKLADFKASLSDDEIQKLIKETEELKAYQEAEETKEAIESIPLLKRSDIKREVTPLSNIEEEASGMPLLWHDYFTNGIAYVDLIFDSNEVVKTMLPELSLLKSIISFVDTENYSYADLNNEINTYTGGLGFDNSIHEKRFEPDKYSLFSSLSFKTLYENIDKTFDLAEEVLFDGKYDDYKRLYEIIAELKSKLQMSLISSGHVAAYTRAVSYYSKSGFLREQLNGIEFYKYVENLESHFDDMKEKLARNLRVLLGDILRPDGIMISYTGDKDGLEILKKRLALFKEKLDSFHSSVSVECVKAEKPYVALKDRTFNGRMITPKQLNEGFITSSQVNYVARAGFYTDNARRDYRGSLMVLLTMLRFDYMWFNIRVQGGAYGCMTSAGPSGKIFFVSYRDPNVGRTNDVFEGIAEYAENFDADEREMTKYVIGTISGADQPLTPSMKGARDLNAYISEITIEDMMTSRKQIIDCTKEDIRYWAPFIRSALDAGNICVVGNDKAIKQDEKLFKNVRNLFE